ncbi:sigma factor-like helix-turn-helix DNA-binding protein [Sphingobacterium hungaricum]|nr:sigma factor-like helix-turn-helix DNA-binding protein [Sphingobacterium hungaricum]
MYQQQTEKHVSFLREGDERGLAFFYQRFYAYLFAKTLRATKDDCAAASIAQEALLRLWLCRQQVKDASDILSFLKLQVNVSIQAFYSKSGNRFYRSLLSLDALQEFQHSVLGIDPADDEESDLIYSEELEQEKQQQLDKLNSLLPSLGQQQQLFIKLCLHYSFNYERIAYYLGGISEYEVGLQVEKTIETLRSVFFSVQKMNLLSQPPGIVLQGTLDKQQEEIFRMRYELQWSFEQISEALGLHCSAVKTIFVQAHSKIKKIKKRA